MKPVFDCDVEHIGMTAGIGTVIPPETGRLGPGPCGVFPLGFSGQGKCLSRPAVHPFHELFGIVPGNIHNRLVIMVHAVSPPFPAQW
jgi:hypothetical protein